MFGFELKRIGEIPLLFGRAIRSYRFALAAFLIPLFIRSIPEILVGPYPIGWDTIAFYVPNTLDWATGKVPSSQILGTGPLMFLVSTSLFLLLRVDPIWIFKIMGPILYGNMIWALFRFLKIGLKWPVRQALAGALLTSLYFVTLRISWDLYKNMLGLTFVLLSIPFMGDLKDRKHAVLVSLLTVLAVASDPLIGVIALFGLVARAVLSLSKGKREQLLLLVKVSMPGVLLFLTMVYAFEVTFRANLAQPQPPLPTANDLSSSVGFLGYAYLPMVPLMVLGFRRVQSLALTNWTIICLALTLTTLVPFWGLNSSSYRWALLLDIPFCIYAVGGLNRLAGTVRPTLGLVGLLQRKILPIFSTLLILSAFLYTVLPAQQAMVYYTVYPSFLPTSMVQDTVPLSDMQSLGVLLRWVAVNMDSKTALIAHQALFGWARDYLPTTDRIFVYGFSSPSAGVEKARSDGFSSVLMIWWANGLGWYGQPSVPSAFVPIQSEGNLALYRLDFRTTTAVNWGPDEVSMPPCKQIL
jgi:hypothetical protein